MNDQMPLGVKKLCYDARLPTRGSDGAVGYDLYSSEDATVPCQAGRALVGTGIALSIPRWSIWSGSPSFWSSCEALYQCWCGCY
jgi:dUTPase